VATEPSRFTAEFKAQAVKRLLDGGINTRQRGAWNSLADVA
jgi:hypothetical protein